MKAIIDITNLTSHKVRGKELQNFARRVIRELKTKRLVDLSVVIASPSRLASLNAIYRHRQGSTDILSFPLSEKEEGFGGEIYINWQDAAKLARQQKKTTHQALKYLLIHGILHLVGYDHEGVDKQTAERMYRIQEHLSRKLNVEFN